MDLLSKVNSIKFDAVSYNMFKGMIIGDGDVFYCICL